VIFRANTDRLLERVLERVLPALIAVAADPVVVVNEDGVIVLANHHAYHAFGWDAGSLEGRPLDDLIPERLRATHKQHRKAYMAAPQTRATHNVGNQLARRSDGSEFRVEIGLTPIGPDSHPGRLVMAYVREVPA
jgi:PAS domain S-box-containing protein